MATSNYQSSVRYISDITVTFSNDSTLNGWPLANIKVRPTIDINLKYEVKILVQSRNWMTQVKVNKQTNRKLFEWGEYHKPGRYSLNWTRIYLEQEGLNHFMTTWPFQFGGEYKISVRTLE